MSDTGLLITFEGGDGAGKTTLIERLYEALQREGHDVLKTRAPGGTAVGQGIRSLLLHTEKGQLDARAELLLFLADRAQHVQEVILPALQEGKIVLCDRYNDSTLAYQGGARGFASSWVRKLCAFASQQLTPHLTLYLDLDPKLGLARVIREGTVKDRIESEALRFHRKIRAAFRKIAAKEPKRFHLLDASGSADEVFAQAKQELDVLLTSCRQ